MKRKTITDLIHALREKRVCSTESSPHTNPDINPVEGLVCDKNTSNHTHKHMMIIHQYRLYIEYIRWHQRRKERRIKVERHPWYWCLWMLTVIIYALPCQKLGKVSQSRKHFQSFYTKQCCRRCRFTMKLRKCLWIMKPHTNFPSTWLNFHLEVNLSWLSCYPSYSYSKQGGGGTSPE